MADFLPFVRRWFEDTFAQATRPQIEGWEAIASGRDTLIVAPTGSGKTLAAFLWALDHLHRLGLERRLEDRVYVVYVSPLRALNNDIEKNLRAPLGGIRAAAAAEGIKLPEVRVAVRTGDTLAPQRQAMTRRPPHVLITTPESLYILLTSERFRPAFAHTRFLIVDEIHALMGSKRGAHLALSLERLQALAEASGADVRPQRIGCSATVSPIESALAFLTGARARRHLLARARDRRRRDRPGRPAPVPAQHRGGAAARGPRRPPAEPHLQGADHRDQGRGASRSGGRGAIDQGASARPGRDARGAARRPGPAGGGGRRGRVADGRHAARA